MTARSEQSYDEMQVELHNGLNARVPWRRVESGSNYVRGQVYQLGEPWPQLLGPETAKIYASYA